MQLNDTSAISGKAKTVPTQIIYDRHLGNMQEQEAEHGECSNLCKGRNLNETGVTASYRLQQKVVTYENREFRSEEERNNVYFTLALQGLL
jgi:hypothetical protein